MKIHLARFGDHALDAPVDAMARLLETQAERRHQPSAAAEAEAIVFAQCHMLGRDWRLDAIAGHELAARFAHKIYVYDERDRPWLRFPGLYVSTRGRHLRREWQVPAPYYLKANELATDPGDVEQDLLFSFVGSPSARCRYDIYRLHHARGHVQRIDGFVHYDPQSTDFAARTTRFADVLARSKFVLCPRGQGISSLRLYEVLAAGRVPVILADDWVPPEGPVWDTFSLRWPEGRIAELPAELERREGDHAAMTTAARAAYRTWFAPDCVLTRQFDLLAAVVEHRRRTPFPVGGYRNGAWRAAGLHNVTTEARHRLSPVTRRLRSAAAAIRRRE